MKFQYSYLVDPSSYETHGLCDGIPLRVHRNTDLEEAAVIRLRNDWARLVGPLPIVSYGASMGPYFSFTSVVIPECRPDRLEIVSYVMEFGFLYDDLVDASKIEESSVLGGQMIASLSSRNGHGRIRDANNENRPQVVGQILHDLVDEMRAIDEERAAEVIKYWKQEIGLSRGRTDFTDLDDYLEYRVMDVGRNFVTALTVFGMGLTIPPGEKDECFRLTRPMWAAAALTNDVQSWDKECELAKFQDKAASNAVSLLIKKEGVDVDEAKHRVLEKVKDLVAEHVATVKAIHTRLDLSSDSRCYVEATLYMISGNLVWGMSAPRYHKDQSLTDMQVARMKNEWPVGRRDLASK